MLRTEFLLTHLANTLMGWNWKWTATSFQLYLTSPLFVFWTIPVRYLQCLLIFRAWAFLEGKLKKLEVIGGENWRTVSPDGFLSFVRNAVDSNQKGAGKQGKAFSLSQVWFRRKSDRYKRNRSKSYRAFFTRTDSYHRKRRSETADPTEYNLRMYNMRKQLGVRVASPNPGRRRSVNSVLPMHKMQPHLQRIQLKVSRSVWQPYARACVFLFCRLRAKPSGPIKSRCLNLFSSRIKTVFSMWVFLARIL